MNNDRASQFYGSEDLYKIKIVGSNYIPREEASGKINGLYQYFFDDVNSEADGILITPDISKNIIYDFEKNKNNYTGLLISCKYGAGRSPAVAMALNEVFNLGHDTFLMSKEFPQFNNYVFQQISRVGTKKTRKNE